MALHTLGLSSTTALQCTAPFGGTATVAAPTPSDVAAANVSIVPPSLYGAALGIGFPGGAAAVLATGTLNATALLSAVTARAGSVPVSQILPGDLVLGIGIVLGTFVQSVSGSNVTLSQAAASSASGVGLIFVRAGSSVADPSGGLYQWNDKSLLYVPDRGVLKVGAGDVIAVDNTGWPILIPQQNIGYAASQWTFT